MSGRKSYEISFDAVSVSDRSDTVNSSWFLVLTQDERDSLVAEIRDILNPYVMR